MEVITIESKAFEQINKKLEEIYIELKQINSPKEQLANDWLSAKEVEELLGVCQKTRINYQNAGILKPTRIKRRVYYKLEDVKNLISNQNELPIRLK